MILTTCGFSALEPTRPRILPALLGVLLSPALSAQSTTLCKTDDDCPGAAVCAEDFGGRFGLAEDEDVCVEPGSLPPPEYEVLEIPPISTPFGTLDSVSVFDVNGRGQVVGQVDNRSTTDFRLGAYRFTPGVGMEDLDPDGTYRSDALLINEAGDVYGQTFDVTENGPTRTGLFLHRPGTGFEFLSQGTDEEFAHRFSVLDMNDAGDVVGVLVESGEMPLESYLYRAEDGWTSLFGLDERFRRRDTVALAVNNAGEILFTTVPPPSRAQDTFLWLRTGRVQRFRNFGRRITVPRALDDAGRVIGFSETKERQEHAFVFDRGVGMTDLHRGNFSGSSAQWVSSEGVVGGIYSNPLPSAFFTYDDRRSRKIEVLARKRDFQALLPAGATFEQVQVLDMNERLEIVGRIVGRVADETVIRFFYFSSPVGILDLQELLSASGSAHEVAAVRGISDRGAVVLALANGALVLSPE